MGSKLLSFYPMFQSIGSFIIAAVVAIPVCNLCLSVGFVGVAAFAGAGLVMALVS
jgi:hypothetical protein